MSEKELNNQLIENESTETDEVVSDLTESSKKPNGLKGILSKKKMIIVCVCLIAFLAILYSSYIKPNFIVPMQTYNSAMELYNNGEFTRARETFESLGDYKDSAVQAENCEIARADKKLEEGDYKPALDIYIQYPNNPNASEEKIEKCKDGIYDSAVKKYNDGNYENALTVFGYVEDYKESKDYIEKCNAEIEKKKKEQEKAAKEAAEKKAAEDKEKMQKLVGTWYAKEVYNYRDEDMADQMGDLSTYYFTFNDDGTGICHLGEYERLGGGTKEFTWKIQEGGNGAIGIWTLNGDSETIFYYGDHILMYTYEIDSIFYDMRFFCYK